LFSTAGGALRSVASFAISFGVIELVAVEVFFLVLGYVATSARQFLFGCICCALFAVWLEMVTVLIPVEVFVKVFHALAFRALFLHPCFFFLFLSRGAVVTVGALQSPGKSRGNRASKQLTLLRQGKCCEGLRLSAAVAWKEFVFVAGPLVAKKADGCSRRGTPVPEFNCREGVRGFVLAAGACACNRRELLA
jgi:hypothetical protein